MRLLQAHSTLVALALAASSIHSSGQSHVKRLEEQEFGKTQEGAVVKLFTLRNAKGMSAKVMTYGAIITEIKAPDRHGAVTNVVLGAGDFDQLIMAMRAERFGRTLMHRRRRRVRDRRADQAGEKAAIGRSRRSGGRAHDLVIGRNAR